jgi:hypothetical protein
MLNEILMNPAEAEAHGSTKYHGCNKRAGEKPKGASADLNGPKAHGDHDKEVVKSGQGVKEASLSSSGQIHAVELGRMGGGGNRGTDETCERKKGEMTFHPADPAAVVK